MATEAIKGDASFTYTPVGGSETVHTLAIPLFRPKRVKRRRMWQAWSSDFLSSATFSLATGAEEIAATIRLDNEPDSLLSMLEEAMYNEVTLTYSPDGVDTFATRLVSVEGANAGEVAIQQDADLYGDNRWMARVVLRGESGVTFADLLPDSA